ncbi:tail fiber assembly protein [Pseudomonas sp. NPDC096950]|uniref:tail fiber assembly protein n=1 Tax=Pseudomonas sp. NPDC096950 TaxID=3364485 RepID=UPI00383AB9AD
MSNSQVFFSVSSGGFYLGADQEYYESLDSWPNDAIKLTEEEQSLYWKQSAPFNKVLGLINGRPAWVDLPPPTTEEVIARVEAQRDGLLREATLRIDPLQDAVDVEDATAQDIAILKKWKQYRVALNRIQDQSGYPDAITWPVEPGGTPTST